MSENLRTAFLHRCDQFLAACERAGAPLSDAQLSRQAVGDNRLLRMVRAGRRSPSLDTAERFLAFMEREAESRRLDYPPGRQRGLTVRLPALMARLRFLGGPFLKSGRPSCD